LPLSVDVVGVVVVILIAGDRVKETGYHLFMQRVEEPFILAVKEELGDRFTISVDTIYRTTIRYIVSTLSTEFRQSRQQQQQQQSQPQQPDMDGPQLNNVSADNK